MLARLKERYARALATAIALTSSPTAALAQSLPSSGGCGSSHGFNLGTMIDTLQYIAGVCQGPLARAVIIIGTVIAVIFVFFSGDIVGPVVKIIVGGIVGVVFLFAMFAWLTGFGSGCTA